MPKIKNYSNWTFSHYCIMLPYYEKTRPQGLLELKPYTNVPFAFGRKKVGSNESSLTHHISKLYINHKINGWKSYQLEILLWLNYSGNINLIVILTLDLFTFNVLILHFCTPYCFCHASLIVSPTFIYGIKVFFLTLNFNIRLLLFWSFNNILQDPFFGWTSRANFCFTSSLTLTPRRRFQNFYHCFYLNETP